MSLRLVVTIFAISALVSGTALVTRAADAAAANERVHYNFKSYDLAGASPSGSFVADASGNLYGVSNGGTYNMGAVFRLRPNGDGTYSKAVIYSFQGSPDGSNPTGPLALDSAGNLYGTLAEGSFYCNYCGIIFELSPQSNGIWKETTLYQFATASGSQSPASGLIIDKAGNLYGTTTNIMDVVFQLTPTSGGKWNYTVLYTFDSNNSSVLNGLVMDKTGNLYGTAQLGGGNLCFGTGCGLAYKLSRDATGNWTETDLYTFGNYLDGFIPDGTLSLDSSGSLYGTTALGGTGSCVAGEGCGVVFELTPSGDGQWNYSALYSFQGNSDGASPNGSVVFDEAGNLYGTTQRGGGLGTCFDSCGTVFELSPAGTGAWQESVLWRFTGPADGANPSSGLTFGPSGQLLGEGSTGGPDKNGVVYQLTPSSGGGWQESAVVTFPYDTDGNYPESLIEHNGNFYGTSLWGGTHNLGTVFELTPVGGGKWTENVLYSFDVHQGLLVRAISKLVFDTAGNMYGETFSGDGGSGEVFELSPGSNSWSEKVVYQFSGGADGFHPNGGLATDAAGNLYGTVRQGGSPGLGAVFELSPGAGGTWTKSIVHNFTGYPTDGSHPYGGVVFDNNGNLYGTTSDGGLYGCVNTPSCGTVYKLTPGSNGQWSETILHSFAGGTSDGGHPLTPPILDQNGNLFGITADGGQAGNCYSCGTVYELSPARSGWDFTLLHAFPVNLSDGYAPTDLAMDQAGNLYGITLRGGLGGLCGRFQAYCGTAYELSPSSTGWTETILHAFGAYKWDATYPTALILGSDGNLYGTAPGGTGETGAVFEIVP